MSDLQFSCPACGRSFAWKSELAGRRAKCKCGNSLTVPAEPPEDLMDLLPPPNPVPTPAQANCPACDQPLAPEAVLCVNCGYDLRTGMQAPTQIPSPEAAAATPAPAPAPSQTRRPAATGYPISRRPTQEEPDGSTKMYVMLGAVLLLVAMGVGGWIIFRGTGGGKANAPRLGDDAEVEKMLDEDYPKDLTEWIQANDSRMLGGKNARQAAAIEQRLKGMGATKVLAFGNGVLCLCIAIELPDDPAKRQALFEWHNQDLQLGSPRTKDVGQHYILHKVGMM